ncbi:MAG: ATP-binding protein [Bacteroidota bacterium]
MKDPKILLVEDQELIAGRFIRILRNHGFKDIHSVRTAGEAIKTAEKIHPDIALMDIVLPGNLDGIDAAAIIKKIIDIPIIFITGSKSNKIMNRAKELAPAGIVFKNEFYDDLPVMVEFAIYKHNQELNREKAQYEAIRREKKYRHILNAARDGIFFMNTDAEVFFWNNSAFKIFGYSEKEAIGKKIYDLIITENYIPNFKLEFHGWKNSNDPGFFHKKMEFYARRKTGNIFSLELTMTIVDYDHERLICGFVRDITDIVNADEEITRLIEEMQITKDMVEQNASEMTQLNAKLEESEKSLRELNASKDRFFSIIAHDLKGPFQGLLGYTETLDKDVDNLDKDEIKQCAKDLHNSAQNLFKLLENLLEWSRIQRGSIQYEPSHFQLHNLVDIIFQIINTRAKQKNIELDNDVDEEIYLYADLNMTNTIIRNLVSNAVKFTPKNGKIMVSARKRKKNIIISVSDTGVGMSREKIDTLFRIDKQKSTPGTDNEQGTGLGLILCHDLAQKNRGTIEVESEPGEGTTFHLILQAGNKEMENMEA